MRALVGLAALALVTAACGPGGSGDPASPEGSASSDPGASMQMAAMPVDPAAVMGVPDAPMVGPQGRDPQFVVRCDFSHALPDDPIVYPGEAGASHLHTFFGNRDAAADATYSSMVGAETSCEQRRDTASYWAPALLRDGRLVEPTGAVAYYRAGSGIDPTTVQPYPPGLMMIAGDASATSPQPVAVVSWSCGTGVLREVLPPTCPPDRTLKLLVTFPDCWDGEHLDTAGHRDHMRYSTAGACPASHPVAVPQLTLTISYPVSGEPDGLSLTSGGLYSGHADFVNTWDQDKLATEVALCLHRQVVCGVTSGRISG